MSLKFYFFNSHLMEIIPTEELVNAQQLIDFIMCLTISCRIYM